MSNRRKHDEEEEAQVVGDEEVRSGGEKRIRPLWSDDDTDDDDFESPRLHNHKEVRAFDFSDEEGILHGDDSDDEEEECQADDFIVEVSDKDFDRGKHQQDYEELEALSRSIQEKYGKKPKM